MELEQCTKDNTEYLSLDGKSFDAKIVHIYDGDTMHVVFNVFDNFYRWNARIIGVDTPEVRTRNTSEKEFGLKVRDILRDNLLNKIVKIQCFEFDKYGRLLIDVYMPDSIDNGSMLSEWLINNGYAYAYDGGTKKSWDHLN